MKIIKNYTQSELKDFIKENLPGSIIINLSSISKDKWNCNKEYMFDESGKEYYGVGEPIKNPKHWDQVLNELPKNSTINLKSLSATKGGLTLDLEMKTNENVIA